MNDLDLLRELGSESRLLSLTELSGVRERVTTGIERDPGRDRRGPGRRVVVAVVTAGAAAAVALGLVVGAHPGVRGSGHAGPHPDVRGSGQAAPPVLDANLTAKQVLDRAAAAALAEPAVLPRPDQLVYTEVNEGGGLVVRTWLSVDGERNGLETQTSADGRVESTVIVGCVNGEQRIRTAGIGGKPLRLGRQAMTPEQYKQKYGTSLPMDGPVVTEPCTPAPAYFPAMPTRASAMLGYLQRTQGIRLSNLNDLAKTVGSMLQTDYILPAQRAALYEFLATTPGLVVERNARDVDGRLGVGVGWQFGGTRAVNIFDPASYAYLGLTTRGADGQAGGDALLQVAIVNHPGQLH